SHMQTITCMCRRSAHERRWSNNSKQKTRPAVWEKRYSPLGKLILARLREFYREPEALFWVYGFPILMIVALGIAFRNKPAERITVDVQQAPGAAEVETLLGKHDRFIVKGYDEDTTQRRWRRGE